jgi:aspartyl aminopeptidase
MSEKEKSAGTLLKEKLFLQKKNGGLLLPEEEIRAAYEYCEDYKKFISFCKTEREFTDWCVPFLEEKGFRPFDPKHKYVPGDKIYLNNRHKAFVAAVVGKRPLDEGLHIAAAHIDSPRLDLKPNPVYEDTELALFKTHYYGGIKRYQWSVTPLALKGVVIRADGTSVTVSVGEEEDEPSFCVTDLAASRQKSRWTANWPTDSRARNST